MSLTIQHKACDLCYRKKKKCLIHPGEPGCIRCRKSSLVCTASRQQPRAGRPPKQEVIDVARGSLGIWDYTLSPRSSSAVNSTDKSQYGSQTASVRQVLYPSPIRCSSHSPAPLSEEDFYLLNDIYMVGPTFAKDFQRALQYCHCHSPGLLDEIFLALGSCLSWARFGLLTADQVDVKSGAVSFGKLRNTKILNAHDALGSLMLGQALAAFNSLIILRGTTLILRFSLSLVQPWYPDIARIRFLEPISIAPIFWDTVWCLLHREVPVIRPLLSRKGVIDRVAGLCTSLLPTLYELCVFSNNQKNGSAREDTLNWIEQQMRDWTPDEFSLSPGPYSMLEILSMRTQATMYRTAGLLLVHWLRQPLTCNDPVASAFATEILAARAHFFAAAGPSAKLQHAVFPTFLAFLEVSIAPESTWEISTRLCTRPACMDGLVAFNSYVWEQRRRGFNGSLFELIETGPDFVSVP